MTIAIFQTLYGIHVGEYEEATNTLLAPNIFYSSTTGLEYVCESPVTATISIMLLPDNDAAFKDHLAEVRSHLTPQRPSMSWIERFDFPENTP